MSVRPATFASPVSLAALEFGAEGVDDALFPKHATGFNLLWGDIGRCCFRPRGVKQRINNRGVEL